MNRGPLDRRGRLSPHESLSALDWQLLCRWEVVLFAADFAVVFGGHLEEFKAAVGGEYAALVAQGLHFRVGQGLEVDCDF